MARIEDYALLADMHSAALVSRDGSIDWLCWPRFDSAACFAALLGTEEHGCFRVAPAGRIVATHRRYRPDTMILETRFTTETGEVLLVDCLVVPRGDDPLLIRQVQGVSGNVRVLAELRPRFDYGRQAPTWQCDSSAVRAVHEAEAIACRATVPMFVRANDACAEFEVAAGNTVAFELSWGPASTGTSAAHDLSAAVAATQAYWEDWTRSFRYAGPHRDLVLRSVMTLKGLTYAPTGAVLAAPTTSLPERIGGTRNWDYRYCWLRDATLTLLALMDAGFSKEAREFSAWLTRAVTGRAEDIQIAYTIAGGRELPERSLPWLPGYEHSRPVRVGNLAATQLQLDVSGEIMDCLYHARQRGHGADFEPAIWQLQCELIKQLEQRWSQPDNGLWEVRGTPQHFTHSRVMCWVAVDRAIKSARDFGLPGPVEVWRKLRDAIRAEVLSRAVHPQQGHFVRSYESRTLDASLLLIPLVGFLPATDHRVVATVAAVERELRQDILVYRYDPEAPEDGLPRGEGAFLACSFWLASNYFLQGQTQKADQLFERLLGLTNDVGLLPEQYDLSTARFLGNFPQAFSHLALVDTAFDMYGPRPPAPRART